MQKDFNKWNNKKKIINSSSKRKFFFKREIWWCALGVNVGREQDGRGVDFERPILIIKKLSPDTFLGVPLGTKKRLERFQSVVNTLNVKGFALLDQIRVIDSKRLKRKIGMIKENEFFLVMEKIKNHLQ